ncbi:D-alanine--D-alanine ligase family protein [Salisaeta longa]|uniref:D-alanine--D-alanine ligase family protein n=1 Tax=Salisaeta longa TaxID=503170 RepID=UPI0003B44D00|nr:D-alanine--D-alanine ligase [Salisaeta longa]
MDIGLIYDTFDAYPWSADDPPDADAEFEPEATVDALAAAVEHLGHTPVRVGTARMLQQKLCDGLALDAAINITESAGSRNREAYAPILLEMAGIPCVGSDALTLSLTLDKAWTKTIVADAGVPTPPHAVVSAPEALDATPLPPFPLFVKPRYEGSSKGITPDSVVHTPDALHAAVARVTRTYRQDALVEAFVPGGEFTVAVVGHDPPEALPVLQRAVEPTTHIGLHALEHRGAPEKDWDYTVADALTPALEDTLHQHTRKAFAALECHDFARADFRLDEHGQPFFLEINPLPTFAPDGTFAIIAELMGTAYPALLGDVFGRALRRLGCSA